MAMEHNLTNDWTLYFEPVLESWNKQPKESLGNLTPNDFQSSLDDYKKFEALKKIGKPYHYPNYDDWLKAQESYERNGKLLQVKDYVFLRWRKDPFEKGAHRKVKTESYLFSEHDITGTYLTTSNF